MLKSQTLQIEQSQKRERVNALLGKEELTGEERTELTTLTDRLQAIEPEYRAAVVVEAADLEANRAAAGDVEPETRERMELRGRASLSSYLLAAARGRMVDGPEAELAAAAGVNGIPLELWDVPGRAEERAVTPAPGTVGVNLDPIRPAVFSASIAARLGIDMPRVASGTYASATITTSQSAAAKQKSPHADAAAVASAGAMTVTTATPKRISARLELALEDIAAVGQENFESILRQNLGLVLSDELDDQAINGNGAAPNLIGVFERLTNAGAPAAAAETWVRFLAIQSGGIDGLWAGELDQIALVVNPETFRLAAATFQGNDSEESAASYLKRVGGGFWTNKRMPDKVNHVAPGILYRMGRSMMGGAGAMRTAVCPHWGEVSIDDIYSGAASGTRSFTMHVLLGDVILVQPDAYAEVAFRVSVP